MKNFDSLVLRIFQAQPEKMKELYGDPRGVFDSMEERQKFNPLMFNKEGDLDMGAFTEVFNAEIYGAVFFYDIRRAVQFNLFTKALVRVFDLCNDPRDLQTMREIFYYKGRSMSVGDVVEFKMDGVSQFFFCDALAWEPIKAYNVPLGFSVGDGATMYWYSDSSAHFVSRISESGKTVWIKDMTCTVVPKEGGYAYGDDREYTYEPDHDSPEITCKLRKDGRYYGDGRLISMRGARKYVDPHF